MNEKLTNLCLEAQIRLRSFWEDFKTEEKGAAEIVAIILIIVVVIAMVVIFRDRIETIIEGVFDDADTFVGETVP